MIEKIQGLMLNALNKIGSIRLHGVPKKIVNAYKNFIVLCAVLFIIGWLYNWYQSGKADLPILNSFILTITGGAFVSAVLFLVKGNVDEDGDGIPEKLLDDKKDYPPVRRER